MSRRSTNFDRGVGGNVLPHGANLTITIADNPTYIIGRLFKRTWWGKRMIQIEQTGTKQNPQNDSITFEMKERRRGETVPMPPGKYRVSTYAYFPGLGGKRWGDNFEVV